MNDADDLYAGGFDAAPDLSHITPDLRPLAKRISEFKLDPDNERTHDVKGVKAIAESLKAHGQMVAGVANSTPGQLFHVMAKGNGLLEAAKLLGWRWLAVIEESMTPAKHRRYRLADNRIAELSGWDYQKVSASVQQLQADGQLGLDLGWSDEELLPLLHPAFQTTQTDETFTAGDVKGRPVKQLSAADRLVIDRAVETMRDRTFKGGSVTEGAALAAICQAYLDGLGLGAAAPVDPAAVEAAQA